ncbi:MAG: ABC-F type ribosomal protection protein [Clostridium sp.]|uniref:ribosomal protection-like ABC-F family protein n=1 Tax=Clostridium sp. TaxID=1506 RepID=UPI002A860153|nr:ABC-F type ribosomal protection protein [Clostridium sp.]MDY5097046.1 ABC-F type ribosomal protection protein [Clostridium sp.]
MLLLELENIKKYFGDRLLFDIEELRINEGERIGIVGVNGCGKTTLMNIITGNQDIDEGKVNIYCDYSYISQFGEEKFKDNEFQGYFKLGGKNEYKDFLSGGEKLRLKISKALSENKPLLLADEPTTNVDIKGIEILEEEFQKFRGAILLISHDREFLDKVCTRIIEIEDKTIKEYEGNFTAYINQKEENFKRRSFEYNQYVSEKKRLNEIIIDTKEKSRSVRKAPRRFGNSEARLCKMGDQKAKKNLDNKAKAIKSRLDRLEVKEKPKEVKRPIFDVNLRTPIHSKKVIQGKDITIGYGEKNLIEDSSFSIKKNKIIGFIGENGCGKTSLIKAILDSDNGNIKCGEMTLSKAIKIGYFAQDLTILNEDRTLIQNIMDSSIYDETLVGISLVRMGFSREDFKKKAGVLSGGERVKASLCKIFTSDFNVLILDEPTNYLDIYAMEELEDTLKNLEITILIVSHDRRFLSNICDGFLIIKDGKLIEFNGTYDEYVKFKDKPITQEINKDYRIILENKLSEVISLISIETAKGNKKDIEELDAQYNEIVRKLRDIR